MKNFQKDPLLANIEETTWTATDNVPPLNHEWPLYKMATNLWQDKSMWLIAAPLLALVLYLVIWQPWHSGMVILL